MERQLCKQSKLGLDQQLLQFDDREDSKRIEVAVKRSASAASASSLLIHLTCYEVA
jgi:hypothetical protein